MNHLTWEQLADIKERYREKGRIGVTNHELGDLLHMVGDLLAKNGELEKHVNAAENAYIKDLAKFREIKAIVERDVNYGPIG